MVMINTLHCQVPRYKCHKEVWAFKIAKIERHNECDPNAETDGSAMITPFEEGFAPFRVDCDYMRKHKPEVGGYYVMYEDGYKSFSPAKAFEDGYTLICSDSVLQNKELTPGKESSNDKQSHSRYKS